MRNTVRRLVLVVMTMFLYVGLFLSHQQILVQAEQNDNVTFDTELTNAYVNNLPVESFAFANYHVLPKGSYKLTENLTINMPLLIEGDMDKPVHLNLNGHSIKLTGQNTEVIRLKGKFDYKSYRMMRTTLHIYDIKTDTEITTTGNITHDSGYTGNGITVGQYGRLYMHGGKISGNNGSYGGGIFLYKETYLYMYGGEISGNTAYEGGGVYLDDATCRVSFSGTFKIDDNHKKNSTTIKNNLYLPWGGKLDLYNSRDIDNSSRVGITTQAKPTSTTYTEGVLLWESRNQTANYAQVFKSDESPYSILENPTNHNGYLTFNTNHKFKVHFVTNCNTSDYDVEVEAMLQVSQPEILNTGYTLDRWYTDSGFTKPYNFDSAVLSDLTLYAKWIPNTHTVTFILKGGQLPPHADETTKEVTFGSAYGPLPEPVKVGYVFDGWYTTESTGGTKITATSIVEKDENHPLYARYTEAKYTVRWLNYDGAVLYKLENVGYGDEVTCPDTVQPTRPADTEYTYTFSGWTPEQGKIYWDTDYIATFSETKRQFKITWKNNNGYKLREDNVAFGATPSYGETDPQRAPETGDDTEHYTYPFIGWSPSVVSVTGDAVYTAQYEKVPNTYTIKFLNEDGSELLQSTDVTYGDFPTYTGETPQSGGKTFIGWSPELTTVTGNETYTAKYTDTPSPETTFTIQYVRATDGLILKKAICTGTTDANDLKPTGNLSYGDQHYVYTFNNEWEPSLGTVSADTVYKAKYTKTNQPYKVTWVNFDGTVLETDESVEFGTMPSYEGTTPTKPSDDNYNYTFNNWISDQGTIGLDVVRRDITYTASFSAQIKTYTITWVNDNTVLETDTVNKGEMPVYNGDTPVKPSDAYTYTFAGWSPNVATASMDQTYEAIFTPSAEKNKYTVVVNYPNGTQQTFEKKYGDKVAIEALDSTGIERFEGWYDQNGNVFDFNTEIKNDLVLTAKQYEYRYTPDSSFTWVLGTSANQNATVKRFVGETFSGKDKDAADVVDTYQSFLDNGSQLYVDDTRLKENDEFSHNEGSLVVTLSADMLNSLSVGTHRLRAVFTDGYADLMFNVINENDPIPAAPEAPHTDNVVTCQMAGFPANYEWNEAAKACQPGYLDESGVFHSTSVRKAAVNTYDKGLEGNKISFVTAMISSFIAAYLLMKFD